MNKNHFFFHHRSWLWPLLGVLLVTPFLPFIDLSLSRHFYTPSPTGKGDFVSNGLTLFLFRYGEFFGFLVGGITSLLLLLSFIIAKLKPWRQGLMLLSLTWFVGVGFLCNVVFKGYWGRPRPKQITEFAGKYDYRPYWKPDFRTTEPQRSFPSGHAATGFYYISIILLGRRYRSHLFTGIGLALTLFWGLSLSWSRIAQGGHFFSDALFAALIMYWTALFFDWLSFESRFVPYFRSKEVQKG